jgi:DNA-binding NarL/FixJ family response regulator
VDEDVFTEAVAAAYEAATGGSTWLAFGTTLCQLVGAEFASLRLLDGTWNNLLQPASDTDAAYLTYYHRLDPYRERGARLTDGPLFNRARVATEIIPTAELRRTEYYHDYARPNGRHHMMGALLELAAPTPLGLHRDAAAGPFTEAERRSLEALVPHLRRALQLKRRFEAGSAAQEMRSAALDALSVPVFVVDAAMRVPYANAAATTLAAGSRSGLRMVGAGAGGGIRLTARHRDDSRTLEALVAGVVGGGAGGAMRVRAQPDEVPDMASLAVLVSPAPARLAELQENQRPGLAGGFALVVARELAQPLQLRRGILSDLYGLTHAEAVVAVSLAGGRTAEDVARARQVSLDTVRTQVRTVLRKANAANLRDFERILALVSAS